MAHSAVLAKVSDSVGGGNVRVGIEDSIPLAEFRALQRTFEAGRSIWWSFRVCGDASPG